MKAVYTIDPSGLVRGMYNDSFDISFLGRQTVNRASEIVFNKDTQLWDIYILTDTQSPEIGGAFTTLSCQNFRTYKQAREFEVDWLNRCMEHNVSPTSEEGIHIADSMR